MPSPLDGCPMFADSGVRGLKMTFFPMFLVRGVRTFEGLRPSYSAHVRWGEHGAPVQGVGHCGRKLRVVVRSAG